MIKEFTMPESITYVSESMFYHEWYKSGLSNLKRVVLHENIKEIGASAFQGCAGLEDNDQSMLSQGISA